jgi:3-oxoacyl-[acyl-carrier-protein] synthase III
MTDLPPQHRRWWRPTVTNFAEEEARQLRRLALELKQAGDDLMTISRGMRVHGNVRVEMMGSALNRMARRWERRAEQAKRDAVADHTEDENWDRGQFDRLMTHQAEFFLARGINSLIEAERYLDEETVAQVRKYREPLQHVYTEVLERDLGRPVRRETQADG